MQKKMIKRASNSYWQNKATKTLSKRLSVWYTYAKKAHFNRLLWHILGDNNIP